MEPRDFDPRDSRQAWTRLAISLAISTIGSVGFWSFVVALPAVQAEFGASRAEASLPYTLTMVGFAFGGVGMGWLVDRLGLMPPLVIAAFAIAAGFIAAGYAPSLWLFALSQGCLIGLGTSVFFGPILADLSHWFVRRRGLAITICSSGNYLAGTLWPPVLQHFIETSGWRATHIGAGLFCLAAMLPLAWWLRARLPPLAPGAAGQGPQKAAIGVSPGALVVLLSIAGFACCVAMSMPQVHLVAYCADLGYGPARGAEMLSLMLGLGIFSRVASGWLADRIGAVSTLLIGSTAQGAALFLYLWFDTLASLYVISAIFGLFQGGIIPMYTLITREYFPPEKAGATIGFVMMTTLIGMAVGGWLSGWVFDFSGSYRMAFLNGLLWNLLNLSIVGFLMTRRKMTPAMA